MEYLASCCYFRIFTRYGFIFSVTFLLLFLTSCEFATKKKNNQEPQVNETKVRDITEITLERSICFGDCPAYKVTFRQDGSAKYIGEAYTPYLGIYDADPDSCPSCHFTKLVEWLEVQNFFNMQDNYNEDIVDSSRITVTVVQGDKKKTVISNDSTEPIELWGIAMAIDGVVSKIKWKKSASTPNSMKK